MDLIWSAIITEREFSLHDKSSQAVDFWDPNVPSVVSGLLSIDEHQVKIEIEEETIRVIYQDNKIIVLRDAGITNEILLEVNKNGKN